MLTIERNGKTLEIEDGISSIYRDIKNGDILHIDKITDAVKDINEYMALMHLSFYWNVEIKSDRGEFDTTTSIGSIMRNAASGLYEYGINAFHGCDEEPYMVNDRELIREAEEQYKDNRQCIGCSRDDEVVWSYIAPLNRNGKKALSNVVPMCRVHHFARIRHVGWAK